MGERFRLTARQRLRCSAEQPGQGAVDGEPAAVGQQQAHRNGRRLEDARGGVRGQGHRLARRPGGGAELDLGHDGGGKVLEQGDIARGPEPRERVGDAERAERFAPRLDQRHSDVRHPAQLPDGRTGADQRMPAGVVHDQGFAEGYHVTAE